MVAVLAKMPINAIAPFATTHSHRSTGESDQLLRLYTLARMDNVVKRLQARAQQHPADSAVAAARPSALLENVELHDYQLRGVRWLLAKYAQQLNPILGDEMGLGKTLQVIAFVAALIEQFTGKRGNGATTTTTTPSDTVPTSHFLIVAPLSVLPNWMEQFERFAPSIEVLMYAGQKTERAAAESKVVETKSQVRVSRALEGFCR